jgi:hypothetical protein
MTQNPLVHLKDVVILKRHMAIGVPYLLTPRSRVLLEKLTNKTAMIRINFKFKISIGLQKHMKFH